MFSSLSACNFPLKKVVEEEVVVEKIYTIQQLSEEQWTLFTLNDQHIGDIYW